MKVATSSITFITLTIVATLLNTKIIITISINAIVATLLNTIMITTMITIPINVITIPSLAS